jgi:hypothetical protein
MKNYKGLLRFARNDNPMSLRGTKCRCNLEEGVELL